MGVDEIRNNWTFDKAAHFKAASCVAASDIEVKSSHIRKLGPKFMRDLIVNKRPAEELMWDDAKKKLMDPGFIREILDPKMTPLGNMISVFLAPMKWVRIISCRMKSRC